MSFSLPKIIFKAGQYLRNPSLEMIYGALKISEKYSRAELEALQLKKFKELVNFVSQNSAYYQNQFEKLGLIPHDIQSLADISKLPITTKADLITYNKEIHTTSKVKYPRLFHANTSGSTGESLHYLRDEYTDSFNRASIFRGYSWYQVNPWDYNIYFWGFNFSLFKKLKTYFLDLLVNRYRLFSYLEKDFIKMIYRLNKAVYISGYSSMIYQTAKLINEKGYPKPKNLKLVKGTSEKIYASYQKEVKEAFGQKMISEYGAAETGIIAFECPMGNMHLNMEGVIVEVNEDSEILVTNLITRSFPVIRYKLGDYVQLDTSQKKCPCGMEHPILKEVTGRIGDIVYGKKSIYPSLYFYYIFKNLDKEQKLSLTYQIIQEEKGHLTFLIKESLNAFQKEKLSQEIIKYFKEDLTFEIKSEVELIFGRKGKLKSFISKLSINP